MKLKLQFNFFFFIVITSINFPAISQETIELDEKSDKMVFHLDSVGNIISYEKQLELMRTGDYISKPFLNSFSEIEHLIRKRDPNNPSDKQYQVYPDGKTVISAKGTQMFGPKLNMGDTLPSVCARNVLSNKICIGEGKTNPYTIVVLVNESSWIQIRHDLVDFIEFNSNIDFILISSETEKTLNDFFTKSFLKKTRNIYLANDVDQEFLTENTLFPIHYLSDQAGKIVLLIPPLPTQDVALVAMQKFINSQN